ncbi:MAG TPA: hypothetical protein VFV38_00650, partial [Ktedonobacteraceae bacterium]|nr:hypothetical protein [Ktedonobacteraceae bacterium]
EFVFRSNVTCSRGELVVGVSNGAQTWEEHTLVDSRLQKERETCRLLILATLRAYAPGLLPLLETEGQKEEGGTENHPAAQTSLIQELVFVPVILPKKPFFEHCQFKLNREEKLITMLVKAIIGDILFEVRRCLLLFLIAKRAVRKSRYSKKSVANQMCWFLE